MSPETPMEARIAAILCETGLSFKQIALMVGTTENTAKLYAHRCYKRAGVTTAREFVVQYWKRRLAQVLAVS